MNYYYAILSRPFMFGELLSLPTHTLHLFKPTTTTTFTNTASSVATTPTAITTCNACDAAAHTAATTTTATVFATATDRDELWGIRDGECNQHKMLPVQSYDFILRWPSAAIRISKFCVAIFPVNRHHSLTVDLNLVCIYRAVWSSLVSTPWHGYSVVSC